MNVPQRLPRYSLVLAIVCALAAFDLAVRPSVALAAEWTPEAVPPDYRFKVEVLAVGIRDTDRPEAGVAAAVVSVRPGPAVAVPGDLRPIRRPGGKVRRSTR